MVQLPVEAYGAAAGVMIYTVICLLCAVLLLWLLSTSRETFSCKNICPEVFTTGGGPLGKDAVYLDVMRAGVC